MDLVQSLHPFTSATLFDPIEQALGQLGKDSIWYLPSGYSVHTWLIGSIPSGYFIFFFLKWLAPKWPHYMLPRGHSKYLFPKILLHSYSKSLLIQPKHQTLPVSHCKSLPQFISSLRQNGQWDMLREVRLLGAYSFSTVSRTNLSGADITSGWKRIPREATELRKGQQCSRNRHTGSVSKILR